MSILHSQGGEPSGRVVLNSTEGRIHMRTHVSVVLISTENEKRVTSPRHSPPYKYAQTMPKSGSSAFCCMIFGAFTAQWKYATECSLAGLVVLGIPFLV